VGAVRPGELGAADVAGPDDEDDGRAAHGSTSNDPAAVGPASGSAQSRRPEFGLCVSASRFACTVGVFRTAPKSHPSRTPRPGRVGTVPRERGGDGGRRRVEDGSRADWPLRATTSRSGAPAAPPEGTPDEQDDDRPDHGDHDALDKGRDGRPFSEASE
jgi:hypothetical protein